MKSSYMMEMIGREGRRLRAGEDRFAAYLDEIVSALGHASRDEPARAYCTGLLLPGERKSVEPMAARLDPERVQARHQSMHHIVAQAVWDDAAVLGAVRRAVIPAIERHGPLAYWIVDDTAFPKQGTHSVGVALQYCGVLGKQENCQVAVSLSVANDQASLPIAYQLYLPEAWAADPIRRAKAGVPEGIVLGDAGYGDETAFRVGVAELGLSYVLGLRSGTSVWLPGQAPPAASALVGPGPATDPAAASPRASAGFGQRGGPRPAQARLAHCDLA